MPANGRMTMTVIQNIRDRGSSLSTKMRTIKARTSTTSNGSHMGSTKVT